MEKAPGNCYSTKLPARDIPAQNTYNKKEDFTLSGHRGIYSNYPALTTTTSVTAVTKPGASEGVRVLRTRTVA
jgi:hypothetical protein